MSIAPRFDRPLTHVALPSKFGGGYELQYGHNSWWSTHRVGLGDDAVDVYRRFAVGVPLAIGECHRIIEGGVFADPTDLVVVENWFEELKAKVGN